MGNCNEFCRIIVSGSIDWKVFFFFFVAHKQNDIHKILYEIFSMMPFIFLINQTCANRLPYVLPHSRELLMSFQLYLSDFANAHFMKCLLPYELWQGWEDFSDESVSSTYDLLVQAHIYHSRVYSRAHKHMLLQFCNVTTLILVI